MALETELFEMSIQKMDTVLKLMGLGLSKRTCVNGFVQKLRSRWFFCFLFLWVNTDLLAEVAWFIDGVKLGRSMTELTYVAPCITLTLLGDIKSICFLKNELLVRNLIETLRSLQQVNLNGKTNRKYEKELVNRVSFLTRASNVQKWLDVTAIVGFGSLPFAIMTISYYYSHEINLALPFLVLYPFDVYDLRFYPFVYVHEIFSGLITVFLVFAADYFYYLCCTFIQIQFRSLQKDIVKLIPRNTSGSNEYAEFTVNLVPLMHKHKELIRCVEIMEHIYSNSTLFNVVVSSFLICLTGFNVTAIEAWPVVIPFIAFLILVLVQIYLFCYFGDKVKESSIEFSRAVYNSQWYSAHVRVTKDIHFVLMRSQKPCVLTACRFSEISLGTLTKILSTALSYFALLSTINTASTN